jgi:hypothetical protein
VNVIFGWKQSYLCAPLNAMSWRYKEFRSKGPCILNSPTGWNYCPDRFNCGDRTLGCASDRKLRGPHKRCGKLGLEKKTRASSRNYTPTTRSCRLYFSQYTALLPTGNNITVILCVFLYLLPRLGLPLLIFRFTL